MERWYFLNIRGTAQLQVESAGSITDEKTKINEYFSEYMIDLEQTNPLLELEQYPDKRRLCIL